MLPHTLIQSQLAEIRDGDNYDGDGDESVTSTLCPLAKRPYSIELCAFS